MNKFCVYTVIIGAYDTLREPLIDFDNDDKDVDYICFTDNRNLKSEHWEVRYIGDMFFRNNLFNLSPTMKNRYLKIKYKEILDNEYEAIMYIDCSDQIVKPLSKLFKECLKKFETENISLFLLKHETRETVHDEIQACIEKHKDNYDVLIDQLNEYENDKFPDNIGLFHNCFFIRINTDRMIYMCEYWWSQLMRNSCRDQISLPYVLWKLKDKIIWNTIPHKTYKDIIDHNSHHNIKKKLQEQCKESKICLLTMIKNNNKYMNEFIDHYLSIGFDKIIFCDNNELDGENLRDVIDHKLIDSGKIEIQDYRGQYPENDTLQSIWYKEVYAEIYNDFDWFAFFDQDELLEIPNKYSSIKKMLYSSEIANFQCVEFYWKYYDDNGLIRYDDRPLKERFTHWIYEFKDHVVPKMMIRGKNKKLIEFICSSHTPVNYHFLLYYKNYKISICDVFGNDITDTICDYWKYDNNYNFKRIYINTSQQKIYYEYSCIGHYMHKTIEEFIEQKIKSGLKHYNGKDIRRLTPEFFFRRNKWTPEKQQCLYEYKDKLISYLSDINKYSNYKLESLEIKENYETDYRGKMIPKVALCCIERLENAYLREFVEYYKKIGVDKIFMYDTNDPDEDNVYDVIGDYIDSKFVKLIHWNLHEPRVEVLKAYQNCYDELLDKFDWCCFFDIDEFLILKKHSTIQEYLSDICNNTDIVYVNWINYDDNDLLYYDNIPLMERFTRKCEDRPKSSFIKNENLKGKSIIRTKLPNIVWINGRAHFPKKDSNIVLDGDGKYNFIHSYLNLEFKVKNIYAQLNHYRCKTVEEYCTNKYDKLVKYGYTNIVFDKDFFFEYNKFTPEKNNIYDKLMSAHTNITNKNVFYTCIVGEYDSLKDPEKPVPGFDYICYTDQPYKSDIWEIRPIPKEAINLSDSLKNRYVKWNPRILFPEYEFSVYFDGSMTTANDFNKIKETKFKEENISMYLLPHQNRHCIYKEFLQCAKREKSNVDKLYQQMSKYISENFPLDYGLTHNSILIRYHNDESCIEIDSNVWNILQEYSHRDQLALMYVIWKTNNREYIKIIDTNILLPYITYNIGWYHDLYCEHQLQKELSKAKYLVKKSLSNDFEASKYELIEKYVLK